MAEPFGIAAGSIGIAAAFTACVDCFGYVQVGRHFGRDFQTEMLALNCTRLRLTRWGEAVAIYDDPKLGRPDATEAELRNVKDMLYLILVLFADSEKISRKYRLNQGIPDEPTVSSNELDPTLLALNNKMKELALRRQRGSSIIQKTSWALYHRNELKELVARSTNIIDNIEKLFPSSSECQLKLVDQELAEVNKQEQLRLLTHATQEVDANLHAASKDLLTSSSYSKVVIEGKAQVGDAFSRDWQGSAVANSGRFEDIRVQTGGRALIGNKYGGKDFWDD